MIDIYMKDNKGETQPHYECDTEYLIMKASRDLDNSFFCLKSISLYDNTVFNPMQVKRFIFEWDEVRNIATTGREMAFWLAIREMAVKCIVNNHYLLFVGD